MQVYSPWAESWRILAQQSFLSAGSRLARVSWAAKHRVIVRTCKPSSSILHCFGNQANVQGKSVNLGPSSHSRSVEWSKLRRDNLAKNSPNLPRLCANATHFAIDKPHSNAVRVLSERLPWCNGMILWEHSICLPLSQHSSTGLPQSLRTR